MAAKAKKGRKKRKKTGNHGRRRTPSPSQLAVNPPVDVVAMIGDGPFKPNPKMLECLAKVAEDPTLLQSWARIADAVGITRQAVSYWCGNMSFLAWWHNEASRVQALKKSEAVAVLADVAANGAKNADRVAAAKAYCAAVDQEAPGADAGMAALMRAMSGADADVELKATRGDDVLEVKASTRRRIKERVEARERVGGILHDAASFGVFQAAMPQDPEAALEKVAYKVIRSEERAGATLTDRVADEGEEASTSDNESYEADAEADGQALEDPNIGTVDLWAEDEIHGEDGGEAGRKSRATTPQPKAPPALSTSENEPPRRVLFLDLKCPSCHRVLMKVRHGMSIPDVECPDCPG